LQPDSAFISAFTRLGIFLGQFTAAPGTASGDERPEIEDLNSHFQESFAQILDREPVLNPWFTPEFLQKAMKGIASMLEEEVLQKWLLPYEPGLLAGGNRRRVGLVMAGNIPLVGFHDLMCVMATGHEVLAKPSSRDGRMIRGIAELLSFMDPGLGDRIRFTDERLSGLDAIIATGSNNSSRYFEYYFRDIPHVIRKNRNGVAVLAGTETEEELYALGEDIFTYFGMGCRNVTKLYVPENYDLKELLHVLDRFYMLAQHNKYANNVAYYRTIYLMNRVPFLDNGVLLLKEDAAISSPVGVVYYERYSELEGVQQKLDLHREEIQCVVSTSPDIRDSIQPGTTQVPMPWDYADGVDTIRFLKDFV
jgi:hypothetical protein